MAKLPLLNEAFAQISLRCLIHLTEFQPGKKVKSSLIIVHIFFQLKRTLHISAKGIFSDILCSMVNKKKTLFI